MPTDCSVLALRHTQPSLCLNYSTFLSVVAPGAWDVLDNPSPRVMSLSLTRKVFPMTQARTGLISTAVAKTKRPPETSNHVHIERDDAEFVQIYFVSEVKYGNI